MATLKHSQLALKEQSFKGDTGYVSSFDVKTLSEDGEFEGYASVFGERDQGDDIVMPGAFRDTLAKLPADKVKLLYQHNTEQIIGKWLEMREDAKGLFVKGKLFKTIQKARDVYELMREGVLDGLSIGFKALVDELDSETGIRRLMKLDLREVSVVTFPMLESATISLVKRGPLPTEREFERFLVREAGFSARQAKGIIACGFKSLKNERDAGIGDNEGILEALQGARGAFQAA